MTKSAGKTVFYLFPFALILCLVTLSCDPETANSDCDILIAGGGTGGVAAALQACFMAEEWGVTRVILTEETTWLGGQYTSQGVTASDDNSLVEQGRYHEAASELFFRFHEAIRNLYRAQALKTAESATRNGGPGSPARAMEIEWIKGNEFSPGNAWGSRMSFLPRDGVKAIDEMLAPYLKSGLLEVRYHTIPIEVIKDGNRVTGVKFRDTQDGSEYTVRAKITLDATELGDILPLSGTPYRIGIEATKDTEEPSLYDEKGTPLYPEPMVDCQQSFTYTFAIEWRPTAEDNRLPWDQRPKSYEANRHRFTMVDSNRWFPMTRWNDFATASGVEENRRTGANKAVPWIPSFWTYRRMLDARILDPSISADIFPRYANGAWKDSYTPESNPRYFIPNWEHSLPAPGDVIEVNWNSNDYVARRIIDVTPEERETALREAKELSLGFLFWLWYEAPRDPADPKLDPSKEENWSVDPVTGKKTGWANLRFRPDIMGTEDGLSMYPYIRESRRGKALFTVRQQDLLGPRTSRARLFHDTVGIGHYFLDIHRCDMGCERKRDINFRHVQLSDGSWDGQNSSGRFQIPYGALVPEATDGLLLSCKNIGLTRIAAATYRLHPVEFQIGQAAGAAAAMCVKWGCQPRDLWVSEPSETPSKNEKRLRRLQYEMLRVNNPLFWNEDCGWNTPDFAAVQWVCAMMLMAPRGRSFEPEKPLTRAEAALAVSRFSGGNRQSAIQPLFTDVPPDSIGLAAAVTFLKARNALEFISGQSFEPDAPVTGKQFTTMLAKAANSEFSERPDTSLTRAGAAGILYEASVKRYGLPAE